MEQTIFDKILNTGEAEILLETSAPKDHILGILEVVGELAAAVICDDKSKAAYAIGYSIVALTLLAAQLKLDIVACIPEPYSGERAEC